MEVVSLLTSSISIINCLYIIIHVDYVALRDQYIGDRSLYETDSFDIITEISCDRYANDSNDCSYNTASYYYCQQAVLTCISGKLVTALAFIYEWMATILSICVSTINCQKFDVQKYLNI